MFAVSLQENTIWILDWCSHDGWQSAGRFHATGFAGADKQRNGKNLPVTWRTTFVATILVLSLAFSGTREVRAHWALVDPNASAPGFSFANMAFATAKRGVMAGWCRVHKSRRGRGPRALGAAILWTKDGGHSWHRALIKDSAADLIGVTVSGVWFCNARLGFAIGATSGPRANHSVLLKTTDSGHQWQSVRLPADIVANQVWFGPRGIKGRLLPWYGNTFWQSINGGKTWRKIYVGHRFNPPRWIGSWENLVLTSNRGTVLLTHDAGQTWKVVQTGLKTGIGGISFAKGGQAGWAIGGKGRYLRNGGWGMYADPVILHTTNGGKTWTRQTLPAGRTGPLTDVWAISPTEAWVSSMFGYARTNPYTALPWLLHTTDGGKSWRNKQKHLVSVRKLFFLNARHGWAVGGQGGSPFEPYSAALLIYHPVNGN